MGKVDSSKVYFDRADSSKAADIVLVVVGMAYYMDFDMVVANMAVHMDFDMVAADMVADMVFGKVAANMGYHGKALYGMGYDA